MKRTLLINLMLILPFLSFSQKLQNSFLYDEKGRLHVDTTLQISKIQLEYWQLAEEQIIASLAYNITYVPAARRAEVGGQLIVAFDCDGEFVKNIRLVSKKIGMGLDEEVIKGLEKTSSYILYEFRYFQKEVLKTKKPFKGTYYIPFDFTTVNFYKELENKKAVPYFQLSHPVRKVRTG
jgi:hypothetical protein